MKEFAFEQYFSLINEILNRIKTTQKENIIKAADLMAECTKNNGLIHAFGTGHSHLVAEDIFWRGSTLANIHAILEPGMTGHVEITKSEYMEKMQGAGKLIVDYHRLNPPDVIIVVSNSGNNIVPIDVALESSKRGVKVIAITSLDYANHLTTLHPLGKKLKDTADVVIDNCCPIGDAAVSFEGLPMKVGAISTVAGSFIVHSLVVQTVENLLAKGIKPDIYFNGSLMANSREVEEYNQKIIDKYYLKIRNL
jgi:uncharacterized phosphosugar-binding protein